MILLYGLPRREKKSNDMQHSNELTEVFLNVELKDSKWPSKFWRSYLSLFDKYFSKIQFHRGLSHKSGGCFKGFFYSRQIWI